MTTTTIRVTRSDVGGYRKSRSFKTLEGARKWAQEYVGETPDVGGWYAVDIYGTSKVTVDGCSLYELFPRCKKPWSDEDTAAPAPATKAERKLTVYRSVPRYSSINDALLGETLTAVATVATVEEGRVAILAAYEKNINDNGDPDPDIHYHLAWSDSPRDRIDVRTEADKAAERAAFNVFLGIDADDAIPF